MKKIIIVILLLQTSLAFCQQEASVWYFGENAGLKFENDGTVTPLANGLLNTKEGCSSIADSDGNLLFYTDGRTVWDRNHVRMPNGDFLAGTELFGDASSTQSGIIVPKPGNPNIYYIFTVDEPHHSNANVYPNPYSGNYPNFADDGSVPTTDDGLNNGLNYSIVDLSVTGSNGSIGDIVSRNNHLITYNTNPTGEEIKYKCSEKITAIKNETTNEYWVVTHFINKFYAFKVTSTGVVNSPVITTIGTSIALSGYRRNALGYLKASPDGERLALAHSQNGTVTGDASFTTGSVMVYDFDNNTGVVSNEKTAIDAVMSYGVEFSSDSNKLYTTYRIDGNPYMELSQFDLLAPNITTSKVVINNSSTYLYALQLAVNNKIYVATSYKNSLGVINNPNQSGLSCNYVDVGQSLAPGKKVILGLPPFITSFFNVGIITSNVCVGSTSSFTLNTQSPPTSVLWDFGDGVTSTTTNPNHLYAAAGTYTVTVTATGSTGTATNTREIVIYPLPTLLTTTATLKQCDEDNDGFSSFNLKESISLLVSSPTGLIFSYFETDAEALSNSNPITNSSSYANQVVTNDVVFVRVQNSNGCFRVAQLDLIVSTTLIPASFQYVITSCDDAASGSITDGVSTNFDFSGATAAIEALFPPGQLLTVTYYTTITDALAEANAITNTTNYSNVGFPDTQNIFVRVDSQLNNECLGLGQHITLNVERIPVVQPLVVRHCDDDQDGIYGFDTTNLQATLLNGLTNVAVSYTDSSGMPVAMTNPFISASQTITANVSNTFGKQCDFTTIIQFSVDDLPEAFPIDASFTTACDDEANPALQDGMYPFDTSSFQSTILGSQTGLIVKYYDGLGNLLSTPLPNPFLSATQTLSVEVSNQMNLSCTTTQIIPLVVNERPEITPTGSELVCSNNPSFTKVINAGLSSTSAIGSHSYTWYLNGTVLTGENNYTLTVNTEGVYTVDVENAFGCVSTRTIIVTASNQAIIDAIVVTDLVDENSITVQIATSSLGDYVYSLDNQHYQTYNTFTNLLPGIYTVYVKDLLGCGITPKEVSVLGIPKFFTPNGDGINDYWNIVGVNQLFNANAVLRIYDRFGKVLKQITPLSVGWDGTYNGQIMISDDYWYTVELENGRIAKGHFALKR